MEQETKKLQNGTQQPRSSVPKEINVWEYIRLLNNTCKNFTFAERERIATMLKMHDRRAESLFAYFAEKSITQEMFIEGINQLLLNKNLVQKKAATPVSNKSVESQKNSRILDASSASAIPLIQIDLGFSAQTAPKKVINPESETKKSATIEKLLKRNEPAAGLDTSGNKLELPTPGKSSEPSESRPASNNKEPKKKQKPTSNPFETSHLQKPQNNKTAPTSSTKKLSRSSEKSPKESVARQGSVGATNINFESSQKPTISTTFQVDRLLNKLTSPRIEQDIRIHKNSNTPNISKDYSNKLKESGIEMRIEKLLYGDNYNNALETSAVGSPTVNQYNFPVQAGSQANRIKVSELLSSSPLAENQMKTLMRTAAEFPCDAGGNITASAPAQNRSEGPGFYQKVAQNLENALINLSAKQQQQHNRFPSANPDKRSQEDLNVPNKAIDTVTEPVNITASEEGAIFKSIEFKNQTLMKHLRSTTRKFTNPIPHSYRMPTDTDEKPRIEADRGEVVTLDCEDDEEYNYRPTSVSQQETSRSRNRNEELAGSFGLKGFTLKDQTYHTNLAKNHEPRQTCNKNEIIVHTSASGYEENMYSATQPTLTYSKETQETLGSTNRVNISEFRNSLFRCYESEQIVPEEPSCMEKSNPTTFRKADSIALLANGSSCESITKQPYIHNATAKEEKKNDLFGFNPNNLSENTRSILSSIINNINLEKNLPNLSKHLKKHSISNSNNQINAQNDTVKSMQEWATETSINNEAISKQPSSLNQVLSPPSIRHALEEELDTSRNPVLYDDSEAYSVYVNNGGETKREQGFNKELVNLIKSVESTKTIDDDDAYLYQIPLQLRSKPNCTAYEQHEAASYQTTGFCMQNDFSITNQVCTPEYGYKFQSLTGKEDTNGKGNVAMLQAKGSTSNPILASFGGVREQLYDRFSVGNSQYGVSMQSLDTLDSKMMQSLTDLLQSKDPTSPTEFESYKYPGKKTEASLAQTDSQVFREQEEESKAFHIQRESVMSRYSNCGEKTSSQPLKETLLMPERVSTTSEKLSNSSCRIENKMITIHALKLFCEQNQIFAENLVDEIFRYLNEHLVNKNYFVQILTNYLNCFPPMSHVICHQDIANKIFEISDRNNDGIISINDLGDGCLLFCQKTPANNSDVSLLYGLFDAESKGFILENDMVNLLTKCQSLLMENKGKYYEEREDVEHPRQEAARLFRELDNERRGVLSYWDIYMWKDTFDFAQIIQRVNQCIGTSKTSSNIQQTETAEIRGLPAFVTVRHADRERAFEDGGYLESGPSLEKRVQEEEFHDREFIHEKIYQDDNLNHDLIEEEEDEETHSPRGERRSWQRTRYTLSTIYENSLSRVEDHSFIKNNNHLGHSEADELSSEARSIGYGSANKENWGFLEPDMIGSCQKSARREELIPDSDSKNGSRSKNFGSASKMSDTKDSDLVFVGSTPSKSRKFLTTVDANDFQNQKSEKKHGIKLEFWT